MQRLLPGLLHLLYAILNSEPQTLIAMQAKTESAHVKADKLSAAVHSWGGSMLRRAFVTWRERHAGWQEGRAKVARAAAVWHNRALAAAWQQWKEGAIHQQELRLRLTGALGTSPAASNVQFC